MSHDTPGIVVPEDELQELRQRAADAEVMLRRAEVAERMLERETRLRETILWNLPLLLLTISSNGEVISANRRTLKRLGLAAAAIEGRHFVEALVPADWQSTAEQYLEAALKADRPTVYTCPLRYCDEELLPVEWHALPLRGEAGEPALICQAGIEIDAGDGADLQLGERDRLSALGQLTAGVAHDFNNLLQAIQGKVSLMLIDLDELLDEQVQSGAVMTRRLLEFTETGASQVTRLELNRQVREVTEMFARTRRDLKVELALVPQPTSLDADRRLLDQLILDLLIHAAGHLQESGRITVSTSRETPSKGPAGERRLFLSVWDSGEVPAPDPDRYIGLARLAARLGAGLVHREHEHGGCTVTVRLAGVGEPERPTSGEVPQAHAGRVLLVDDEKVVLDVGARLLDKLGFEVTTALGGREALALCKKGHDFDVVILDLIMPDMSGREVFERLKRRDPDTVVLVASGYSLLTEASELLAAGAVGFLQKPFRICELQERLTALIQR